MWNRTQWLGYPGFVDSIELLDWRDGGYRYRCQGSVPESDIFHAATRSAEDLIHQV